MAFPLLQELLISTLALLVALLYIKSRRSRNQSRPLDWPVVGLVPFLICRFYHINDMITATLAANGRNIKAQGPLGSGLRFFCTCDPANIRHIFTTNHANYPKGEGFAEMFDIYSGTLFTVDDGELWRQQRGTFLSFLNNPKVLALMASSRRDKVVKSLLPLMALKASAGAPFDLRDLMNRLVFDLCAIPIFCVDPGRLSADMPSMHAPAAMDTVMEVAFLRHIIPASCWKLMRRLNIGPERRLALAHKKLHEFVAEMMEKRKSGSTGLLQEQEKVAPVDVILSSDPAYSDTLLLSKTLIAYMVAGRDTVGTALPWVFYNLAMNPRVVSAIRNQLAPIASLKTTSSEFNNNDGNNTMLFFEQEETNDLVYLHAALYESLRLYPPGPFERKTVLADDLLADDLLPSGHRLYSGETVLISIYAMGRMETVWGEDCHEYRPERWLSEDGTKLRHVPAHKFMTFNSGPRMCPGKHVAMAQIRTIVAAVMWNFDVEVLEGHSVKPHVSCNLEMKNGLKVIVKKREE